MEVPHGDYASTRTVLNELIESLSDLDKSAILANTAARIYSLDENGKV
jgi:predicted TIM-barrel fold metal-dependent hydrolase